jgi:adenosine/AMP kinase
MLELAAVRMNFPPDSNIIVGQEHFIKTAEGLYEAIVTAQASSPWPSTRLRARA